MLPLSYTDIFILNAPLSLLTACFHTFHSPPMHDFLLPLISTQVPYTSVNQHFHPLIPAINWHSLPLSVFPFSYDLNVSKGLKTPSLILSFD